MTCPDSRLLDALGLDMPAREIILQNPDETLFWIVETFGAGQVELGATSGMVVGEDDLPKDKVGMRHEIGDPLEHAPRFEDECWKCNF